MIRVIVCVTAGALFSSAAYAADPVMIEPAPVMAPVPAGFTWTGFYLGVHGGYLWGDGELTVPIFPAVAEPSPDGWLAGGDLGFLYQFNSGLVAGIEGDAAYVFDAEDTAPYVGFANFGVLEVEWTASARARLGWAFNRFMVSATGGLAYASVDGGTTVAGGGPIAVGGGIDEGLWGWTVGGGAAFAATRNLSFDVNYRYSDYNEETAATPGLVGGVTEVDLNTHTVMLGAKLRFGGGM